VVGVGVVIGTLWALQVFGKEWFQLRSPPDQLLVAPIQRRTDIGGRFRLIGQNPLPSTVTAGSLLPLVVYWRALVEMDQNYTVALWMEDVATSETLVNVEQMHPSDIPTSGWATGLYLRNEWQIAIPDDALPIQYALRIGFRDPATGEMLPTTQGTTFELGRIWVEPMAKPNPPDRPHVRFGSTIELLGTRANGEVLTLYWRTDTPVTNDYTLFIHLLDQDGYLVGQLDGLPYDNRYPMWAWQPGQIIEDRRNLAEAQIDLTRVRSIAVGAYNRITEERLPAVDAGGSTLPNYALTIAWEKKKPSLHPFFRHFIPR
jgi:hypothetical protein